MRGREQMREGWREYQRKLQSADRRRSLVRSLPLISLCILGCLAGLALISWGGFWVSVHLSDASYGPMRTGKRSETAAPEKPSVVKDLPSVLKELTLNGEDLKDRFQYEKGGARFTVETSIVSPLQDFVVNLLQHSGTVKSAVVVMDPRDGRILALADQTQEGEGEGLCLKADFPAASLFKIVSAAAALETAGFTPDRAVYYQGRSHTLYKSQLKEKRGRWVTETTFRKAFARSVNSVFGKLGIYKLGQTVIEDYSGRFLFNRKIPFDLPVAMSSLEIPEDDFGLAEIASGFNKRTLISPLHAVLLAAAVANDG